MLPKKATAKIKRRDKKNRRRRQMTVSGKSVFALKKLIDRKSAVS